MKKVIAIIGLGYVGLPLALEFSKKYKTFGYDKDIERIKNLSEGIDKTFEVENKEILDSKITFTSNPKHIKEANIFIVAVPTPINELNEPNLKILMEASETIGPLLKKGDIIIYESTVYPGVTEDICVPILEKNSSLAFNSDFFVGYSPERINPGDKSKKIRDIIKITSGSTPSIAEEIDGLYKSIIKAGTHKASSIKVAEAAKVIENTQRDINIALMNELSIIFDKLDINTKEVIEAANTKWNFMNFSPGLVGGHCIGVDPYYLTSKAESLGYYPQVVLAGRRINDGMGKWIVDQLIKEMARKKLIIGGAEILILGLTFKENCPDLRNTRVIDIIKSLESYGIKTVIVDPWADTKQAKNLYDLEVIKEIPKKGNYSAAIVAVSHHQFYDINPSNWSDLLILDGILYDLKGVISRDIKTMRL